MDGKRHVSLSESETIKPRSDDRKYVCSEKGCGKIFRRPYRLQIHLRTHTGERPFKCEEPGCDKSYCRQPHLLRHQQNAHRPLEEREETVFICEEDGCGREFTQNHNLQKHLKRHHSVEALCKYTCPVEGCKESFRKHHQLRAHSYTHTNVDPYRCSYAGCRRTFQTTTRLRRHLKIHQGYQCDQEGCNLSFNKWSELRRHQSTDHVEEHRCEECDKVFPKRHLLNEHHRSRHEEKSPLPCPYDDCDRMYWDKRNLRAHIRRYHEVERFACEHGACGKTFASKQRLDDHLKTHSPEYRPPVKSCKDRKKPTRKKMSMASKLSGICDMDIQLDLDPVTLENEDGDGVTAQNTEHATTAAEKGPQCLRGQSGGLSETVVMQTDWGKVFKLQEFPSRCAKVPDSSIRTNNCLVSEDRTGEESMEVSLGVDGVGCSESVCVLGNSVLPSQRIISAPAKVFDSDLEPDSSDCVTLTVL